MPALAGDRALLDVIGYSEDARYFAFEEFGIQDGSGFPYATIYVVDLVADRWVAGTPVRTLDQSDGATLVDARSTAQSEAEATLADLEIERAVETLALIGDGVDDPATRLVFGTPGYIPGATEGTYVLELETYDAPAASPCADWFSQPAQGFTLTLSGDGETRTLHADKTVPESRGCPFTYRLHAVYIPQASLSLDSAVAIVSVYPGGFEGPDRRFLAVPLQ